MALPPVFIPFFPFLLVVSLKMCYSLKNWVIAPFFKKKKERTDLTRGKGELK